MEKITSEKLINKVISKEILDNNQNAFLYLDRYRRTMSIIERTNNALGTKVIYKSTSGSSIKGNILVNAIGTTH